MTITLLILGSTALSKKIGELVVSVKKGNKEKIKADVFFLLLTISVIVLLIVFDQSTK